ncbi:MAG: hypothetical protein H0Z38_05720 [Firmicutes bacterium]|nr:hypothetical protein [Bacillota bacterium]
MAATESISVNSELIREIEAVINHLSGVIASKVVTDRKGSIVEIHVLYEGKRAPKYVAQDIQSVLETRWNLSIDKKIISVAQVGKNRKPQKPLRLQIHELETRSKGLNFEVAVELALNGTVKRGAASGPDTTSNKMRIVAGSTLDAVSQFLPDDYQLALETTGIERVGHLDVVVVVVKILSPRHHETLVGTCVVERDLIMSTVKATLDSLNRRFEILAVAQ